MASTHKQVKLYTCIGENFVDTCNVGHCGETRTLKEWIEVIFGAKADKAFEFFDGDKDTEIIEYLFRYYGKRLKKSSAKEMVK